MRNFLIIVVFILFSSCASIMSPGIYKVGVNSHPQQADLIVKDHYGNLWYSGKTPVILNLEANTGFYKPATYTMVFKKDNYISESYILKASFNYWCLGNFVLLPLAPVGFIIDGINGNTHRMKIQYVQPNLLQDSVSMKKEVPLTR